MQGPPFGEIPCPGEQFGDEPKAQAWPLGVMPWGKGMQFADPGVQEDPEGRIPRRGVQLGVPTVQGLLSVVTPWGAGEQLAEPKVQEVPEGVTPDVGELQPAEPRRQGVPVVPLPLPLLVLGFDADGLVLPCPAAQSVVPSEHASPLLPFPCVVG